MDDLERMVRDRDAVMQTATMNLNLTARENPETVTVLHDKAKELGIPFEWAKSMDNADLHKPLSAAPLHPAFQKYLAEHFDRAAMYRDQLPEMDALVRKIVEAGQTPEERAAALRKLYDEKGVPYPARLSLAQRGYQELSSGAYLKDGRVVRTPVSPQDTLGAEERAFIDRFMERVKQSAGFDMADVQRYLPEGVPGFANLSEGGQKALLGRIAALMEKENAILRQMNYAYPEGWNHLPEEEIRKRISQRVPDISDISIERLRKAGVGEVDPLDMVNVLGLRDLYQVATRLSPEELAEIGEHSSVGDQLKKIAYLKQQSLDLRGRTTAGQVANVVANMIPYMVEFAVTGGLASVAKGGGRVALGTAVRARLAEGGFKGFTSGARALASKEGWKAVGESVGYVLKGEAKRLPAFSPKAALQAYNEWQGGPVYYLNDGEVKVALPERTSDELATLILRNMVQTYMGNVSEWGGEFVPGVDWTKFIPKQWRNRLVQQFVTDISKDNAKRAIFGNAIAGKLPLQGTLPEIVEEWLNNAMDRASTVGSQITGLRMLDMGRESVFGDAEENTVIAVSSLLGSTGGKLLRVPGAVQNYRRLTRFVDTHRGMVDAMAHTPQIGRSPTQIREDLGIIRGGDVLLQMDPEDAARFREAHPEFAEAVGITADALAEAQAKGLLFQISENQLIVEQAKSPANNALGEELLAGVRRAGVTVKEALAADMGEEAVSAFKEQLERLDRYRTKIYAAAETAARSAGVSPRAAGSFATFASVMVDHLVTHSSTPDRVEAALDELSVKFYQDPESFAAKPLSGPEARVLDKVVPEEKPETPVEEKPAETEIPEAERYKILEKLSEETAAEWLPIIQKMTDQLVRQFSSLSVDEGEATSLALLALARAQETYKEGGDATFRTYAIGAIKNAFRDYTEKLSRQTGVSLDEEIGEDGATRQDFVAGEKERPDEAVREREATELLGEWQKALTDRQKQILGLLQAGKTQSEIARELGVTKQEISRQVLRLREQAKSLLMQRDMFYQVGDTLAEIQRALPAEKSDTPLFDLRSDSFLNMLPKLVEIFRRMGRTVVAADGASILLQNEEKGRLSTKVVHLVKVANKENGDRDMFSIPKIRWLPRIAETLQKAQAKLRDPKTGHFAYVRQYEESLHIVMVTREGVVVGQEEFEHGLLTQFVERFLSPKRGKFIVVWERPPKSPLSPASKQVLRERESNSDAASSPPSGGNTLNQMSKENIAPSLKNVKLNQSGKQVVRGATRFAEDFDTSFRAAIALFKDADASTLPHEAAHWMKKMMEALVASGCADEQLTHELETINKWLDRQKYKAKKGTAAYLVEREEMFARAFEAYIQTGKPPVSGVEAAFNTLKHFLMAIYKVVRALPEAYGFTLDEEITSVFEAMLSTEELVEKESPLREAADVLRETYQGLLGLSQDEAKDFIRLIRNADAQMTDTIDRRKRTLLPGLRKQWTEQAEEIMKSMRVYRTWDAITKAGGLDYKSLVAIAGKETADALRAMGLTGKVRDAGADVPQMAEKGGYASPEAMIAELLNTSTPKDFTAQYRAQQEAKFNEDLNMDEAATSARATIATLDRLAELLAEKGGIEGYKLRKAELKANARREIAAMPVKDVVSDRRHIDAVKDLNRKLVHAISKKDFAGALDLADKIRRNMAVLSAKADAKKTVEKTRKLLRRAGTAKRGAIYGIHHEALKELAFYFGFSKRQADVHVGRPTFREQAATPREGAEVFGDTFDWPEFLFREEVGGFQALAYADFECLADFARYLYGEGRELVKEAKGTFAARVDGRVTACCDVLNSQPAKYDDRQDKTLGERALAYGRSFLHWGENLNTLLGRADRFVHVGEGGVRGPNLQLRDLLVDAEAGAIALAEATMTPCAEAIKALDASTKNLKLPQVEFTGDGRLYGYSKWTREMVIAACLNMGNEINRQRLREGYGWEEEDLARIASCLTAEDWRNVQRIWDALGGKLQEAVSRTFLEENHYELKLVPAAPFSVATADGQVVEMPGGYYPIKYVHRTKGKDVALGYSPRKLHAEVSSTHRRSESLQQPDPVKLSLAVPLQHIHEASRYAAMRMACREVLNVVRDSRYEEAFGKTQSFEAYRDVLALMKNIANPAEQETGLVDSFERWARTALTATALMGNLKTVAMQLASLTVGVNELGSYYTESLAAFAQGPLALVTEIKQKSAMMAHRAAYYDIDLRTQVNHLTDSPAEKARKNFANVGYFAMRFMDAGVASIGWYGKYLQTVNQLTAEGVDPAQIEAKAIAQADDFVARTQGAARTLDLMPAQLDRVGRLMSPFITAAGAQYNTLLETAGAIRQGRISGAEALGALLFNLVIPAIYSGAIAALVSGILGDDDDRDRAEKRFVQELISTPFSGIPVARDVALAAGGMTADGLLGGKKLYRGDILDAGAIGAANDILTSVFSGGDAAFSGNWARAAWLWSDAIGSAAHVPAIRIYTKAKKMYENNGGELPEFLQELDSAVKARPQKRSKR